MVHESGEILYGWDTTEGIVSASALEIDGAEHLRLYLRGESGIVTRDRKFEPFLDVRSVRHGPLRVD